jgi:hypothetical protein
VWSECLSRAFVRPRVPCVPCVSRLPPVSFYRESACPVRVKRVPAPPGVFLPGPGATGKKTPGGAGTHTGHTGHADAQRHTDHTAIQTHQQHAPRTSVRRPKPRPTLQELNSRRPGADRSLNRSPRPTQKRPPPGNPTLPPPAPRAPPRACSKAVGEMKALPVPVHK